MVTATFAGYVGRYVVIGSPRSMGDGALTLRWGVLREIRGDRLVLDGYHDSAGIGAYVGGSYRHDDVEFPTSDIVTIREVRTR